PVHLRGTGQRAPGGPAGGILPQWPLLCLRRRLRPGGGSLSCPLPGGPADAEPPRGSHRPRHHSGRVLGDLGTGPGAAGRLYGDVCLMRRSICFAGG
ncbi:helix-turn-helix domain-containing protein, partial [Dysosmobacter welbionis]